MCIQTLWPHQLQYSEIVSAMPLDRMLGRGRFGLNMGSKLEVHHPLFKGVSCGSCMIQQSCATLDRQQKFGSHHRDNKLHESKNQPRYRDVVKSNEGEIVREREEKKTKYLNVEHKTIVKMR